MPQTWSDERLDERFDRIDCEIGHLRTEFSTTFEVLDKRLDHMDKRLDGVDTRLDGIQRAVLQSALILSGAMMTGIVALFSLIATKL